MINNPIEIASHIDPVRLAYDEWMAVGMALKHEGATASDWDTWSQRDPDRYVAGECFRKWDSFRGSKNPKTIATLVALAKDHGWSPPRHHEPGREFDWDEEIPHQEGWKSQQCDDLKILDADWVEGEDLQEPGDNWRPVHDLMKYLATLFTTEEHVGYVSESWFHQDAGRHLPKRGCWDRTAGQLIGELAACDGDIGKVVGDYKEDVGAWIRFNPLDGGGVKDANVSSFRHALVESDDMPVSKQYALIKELELPVAAMVHSGGKSVHAIVRIEADTMEEYRKRVDFLYEVCGRNGLKLDRQNRNPSRLSRMPGVMRNGRKQWLIGTAMGKSSWQEWEEWVVDLNDDLPDIEELNIAHDEPELSPELIEGILREGHKMLLSGSSKAGKSFALIQLAVAIAEGREWFGWKVGQGRVLYVNLELDRLSCRHRFWAIYNYLKIRRTHGMLDVWDLRGSATSMDRLAPKLIRRALKKGYKAVIIDPIYKVLTGDENSAEQMAHFCNQFDKICAQLGAATIVCHHHSKGAQGQKQAQDRASGSGVFSRDPDAIIDMIELEIDEDRRKQIVNRWECDAMALAMDEAFPPGWRSLIGQDNLLVGDRLFDWGNSQAKDLLRDVRVQARQAAANATGWRVEATLREFAQPPTKTMLFRYPIHLMDDGCLLADAKAEGDEPPWMKNRLPRAEQKKRRLEVREERKRDRLNDVETAAKSKFGDPVTVVEMAEFLGCSEKTARRRISEHPGYRIKDGSVYPFDGEEEVTK